MTLRHHKRVVICSMCWRAHNADVGADDRRERWRQLEALISDEHLGSDEYELSDGYCPICLEAFGQALDATHVIATQPFGPMQREIAR